MASKNLTTSAHQYDASQSSDSDDESFVVLSRSLPPESLLEVNYEDLTKTIDPEPIEQSIQQANEAIVELSQSEMSDRLPSLPKVFGLNHPFTFPDSQSSASSNVSDLSPNEVQQKVESLIEENTKLKEILLQNNAAMKRQFNTIAMWNNDVQKVYDAHKTKFAETKAYIDKLKIENAKLKDNLQVSHSTIENLKEEIESLKTVQNINEKSMFESAIVSPENNEDTTAKNENKANTNNDNKANINNDNIPNNSNIIESVNCITENVNKITGDVNKLTGIVNGITESVSSITENVTEYVNVASSSEKSFTTESLGNSIINLNKPSEESMANFIQCESIQPSFVELHKPIEESIQTCSSNNNLLKTELEDAQKKISALEGQLLILVTRDEDNKLSEKETEKNSEYLKQKLSETQEQLLQLNEELSLEHKQSIIKQSRLIDEIETVKKKMGLENSVLLEKLENASEQLMSSQKVITQLKEERNDLLKKIRDHSDEIMNLNKILSTQSLQAKSLENTLLGEKDMKIFELVQEIEILKGQVEEIPILKTQLDIYKEDFEAERLAKSALKSEKDAIAEDLRALQRRNQQLLEEIETYRKTSENGGASSFMRRTTVSTSSTATSPSAPQMVSQENSYSCPFCHQKFKYHSLVLKHVEFCVHAVTS